MSQQYPAGPSDWQGGQQPPRRQDFPQGPPPQPGPGGPVVPGPVGGPGGPQGPSGPGWGQPGPGGLGYWPGQPQPAKKKTGLFIGIGAAALVLMVGVVVLALVLLRGGPTLTSAQFDDVYAKGDSIMGNTIDTRQTGKPRATTNSDECGNAINRALQKADDWFASTAGRKMLVAGARFESGGEADKAYKELDKPCSSTRRVSGSTDGATYQQVRIQSQAEAVIVKIGNTIIVAASDPKDGYDPKRVAADIAKEIKNSAK